MVLIAPSILASDFSRLAEEVKAIARDGADWIHLDVMDGHFVPNLTFGAPIIGKLRPHTKKVFDVHLMIEAPEKLLKDFINAGADYVTVHIEATDKINEIFTTLKENSCKCGITLNPDTPLDDIRPYLDQVDLVLVMSVFPGFGGQKFMPVALDKIKELVKLREENNAFNYLIEVDGGINEGTVKRVKDAGVDVIVAGSFVFKGESYKQRLEILKDK